ncbi:MAG: flavodoxin [Bacilli bacterium]|jgi:multimeric flavodoxin WrbA
MGKQAMKIGIIIHSNTGNTLLVAEKIKAKLEKIGHQVNIERVMAANNDEVDVTKVQLTNIPETKGYDGFVFGAPVYGFMLSGVMRSYLAQMLSLEGKSVYCYLTQHFRFRFLGGNHSLAQFENALINKSALIKGTNIVNWKSKKRLALIDQTVDLINF